MRADRGDVFLGEPFDLTPRAPTPELLAAEVAGLDNLELAAPRHIALARRLMATVAPRVTAIALAFLVWELVVLSGWRPSYVLPDPITVLQALWQMLSSTDLLLAVGVTLRRAAVGYLAAVAIGSSVAILISRFRPLRTAVGSLITGLQAMPSIAWFPLAILLFGLDESAILFVVVLGAAPAIANGLLSGIDQIPPILLRAGHVLGARGMARYRYIILPAALPGFAAGLKQGWAFAWRSLMAGELLVIVAGEPSIGVRLQFARDLSDAPSMLAVMIVILFIGAIVDGLLFGTLERSIRTRWGLNHA
ncbi:MAG TPA: ABC transporter permease [Candidatus Limnocylindrales bacterium]